MRLAARAAVVLVALAAAAAARAETLTPGDYQWLKTHLDVGPDNSVVATLTEAQRAKLHAMIADGKPKPDDKRLAIAQYLAQTVSDSFEATLRQSEK